MFKLAQKFNRPPATFAAWVLLLALAGSFGFPWSASAISVFGESETQIPEELRKAAIIEKLGGQLDLENTKLTDEQGVELPVAAFFKSGKPVILNFIYFECPSLCSLVLNGLVNTLRNLKWNIGEHFEVVTVSISPKETPELAAQKKLSYLKEYGRLNADTGWHFLTGTEKDIRKLADAVGFNYFWDEKAKEYAHAAGIFVVTPEGKLSRTLFGVEYRTQDLRLALLEASKGEIGTFVDQVMMFCYSYDPTKKGYSLMGLRLVQAGGALTVIILGLYLLLFWLAQRRKRWV